MSNKFINCIAHTHEVETCSWQTLLTHTL